MKKKILSKIKKAVKRRAAFFLIILAVFLLITLSLSLGILTFFQAKDLFLNQKFSQAEKKATLSLNLLQPLSFLNLTPAKNYYQTLKTTDQIIILTQQISLSSQKLFDVIINNKPSEFELSFSIWQKDLESLNKKANSLNANIKFLNQEQKEKIQKTKKLLADLTSFANYLPGILGKDKEKTYFILLQNNLELRPSGGFMGSYAKLKFNRGVLTDLQIQDIYVPDGQIPGHVNPPWPIQQAFKQGWWRLRDSNWDPDFPEASQDVQWFFEKGGEEKTDGLIALNLITIKDLLTLVQPLTVPDYHQSVTQENFYQLAQAQAEQNFFPGSTQKKDFLGAAAKQLLFKLKTLDYKQAGKLLQILGKNLEEKQIIISLNDQAQANFLNRINWSGSLKRNFQDTSTLISDYIYLVDTNLGANKANCCVQKQADQTLVLEKNKLKTQLILTYTNNSPKNRPQPPLFWGGVYENFLRVILPLEAENITITLDEQIVNKNKIDVKNYPDKKLKSLGFFVITHPESRAKIKITYEKSLTTEINQKLPNQLFLEIQKQPGIENYKHTIKLNNQTKEEEIKTDKTIEFNF